MILQFANTDNTLHSILTKEHPAQLHAFCSSGGGKGLKNYWLAALIPHQCVTIAKLVKYILILM